MSLKTFLTFTVVFFHVTGLIIGFALGILVNRIG